MVKVLRRRERRILFGIEERNAGKSVDLSSTRDDEPRTKEFSRSQNDFNHGLLALQEAIIKAVSDICQSNLKG